MTQRRHEGGDGVRMKALTRVGEDDDVACGGPDPRVQRRRLPARLVSRDEPYPVAGREPALPGIEPTPRVECHDHFELGWHVPRFEAVLDAAPHRIGLVAR